MIAAVVAVVGLLSTGNGGRWQRTIVLASTESVVEPAARADSAIVPAWASLKPMIAAVATTARLSSAAAAMADSGGGR